MKRLLRGVVPALAGFLAFLSVGASNARAQPTPPPGTWPVSATLDYFFCEKGECHPSHPVISTSITWGPVSSQRMVFATTRVVFGPFHLKKDSVLGTSKTAPPTTYRVEIWARSPAFYGPDGQFAGSNLHLRRIGSASAVLRDEEETKDLFVSATLPGVINAVQLRASINGTVKTSSFPGCGDLPPLGGSSSLDQNCMQAAVNPLAILTPHVAPLAIIYEPPGNCSFAKLTQTDVVGTTMSAQGSLSTSVNTLTDPGLVSKALGAEQQNVTLQQSSPNSRIARLTLSRSQTFGTALSTGLPDLCRQVGANVAPRPNSGPGRGDIFLLMVNQPLIYWDQGGLSNFLFGGSPGTQLLAVPAWELATPAGLEQLKTQNNVSLSQEEANTILQLDPLTSLPATAPQGSGPFVYPALPKRFIPLDQPIVSLPSGLAADFSVTRDEVVSADEQACNMSTSTTTSDTLGLTEKIAVFAGELDLSLGVGGLGLDKDVASSVAEGVRGISATDILGNTHTTTVLGFSSCKGLQNLSESTDTQDAFLKDTNNGINVAPYYDAFFGTVAYVPLAPGMGSLRDPALLDLKLPHFVWSLNLKRGRTITQALPQELNTKIAALGFASLRVAPPQAHSVPRKAARGLLSGLTLDSSSGTISGQVTAANQQRAQALYIVMNPGGKPIAQLWINTVVAP
ncbi:MAG: hypothetical protein ABJB49_06405 [Nitrospirota bacterium]